MTATTEFNPYRTEAEQREIDEARELRKSVASTNSKNDLAWLLSGKRGRRELRRQLREAGVIVGRSVSPSFRGNYGEMCRGADARDQAARTLSGMLAALAFGEIPAESVQLLIAETDA